MSLSHCEYCGTTLDLSISSKCPNCGGTAKGVSQEEKAQVSGGSVKAPESSMQEPAVPQPPKTSTSSSSIKYVCFFLILCIIGGIILFVIFSGNAGSVSGTTWVGSSSFSSGFEKTYYFTSDGTVQYYNIDDKGNHSSGSGSWKQDGSTIYMEFNNKNAEYTGTIRGNRMDGNAWNVNGDQWTWSATKR